MSIIHIARFADGYVAAVRQNETRPCEAAWRVSGRLKDGRPIADVGFAGTHQLAAREAQMSAERWARNVAIFTTEIVDLGTP